MPDIRHIQDRDRSELASLWSLRFGDSPSFVDWFFRERYCPAHSVCACEDGRIVSVVHAWPMRLRVMGKELPALMLCGVATREGYEKRGLMHGLMRHLLHEARAEGFPLVFHKPNRFETYASLSQLPCTDTLHHSVTGGMDSPCFSEDWPLGELLDIYRRATEAYSGCVLRDEAAMRLKLADYRSDGARLIRTHDGYAVLFFEGDRWHGEEVLAAGEEAYARLLGALPKGARLKLPPDLPFSGELRPQNAMGATSVPALLAALCGDAKLVFLVEDPVIPENCGIFDGCGRETSAAPFMSLSSGELVQYLCGYMPKGSPLRQRCFCVDEY